MLRVRLAVTVLLTLVTTSESHAQNDLKSLYETRRWTGLYTAVNGSKGNDLYRGAVAVAFHQTAQAEKSLRSVIRAQPKSDEAFQAYGLLGELYITTGQYRRAMSTMQARWKAFPDNPGLQSEQKELAGFTALPDQMLVKSAPSSLRHDADSIFIPLAVNGVSSEWFFDTGASVSVVSESEARRLGMTVKSTTGTMGTTTSAVPMRTAVAKNVTIGGFQFKDVSFLVLEDKEPWTLLEPGKRGIIGLPLILGFRTLRWHKDGPMEIGWKSEPLNVENANLHFADTKPVLTLGFEGQSFLGSLDTGAENTDLFAGFGRQFPQLSNAGKRDSFALQGAGGTEIQESVALPDLTFAIGGHRAVLTPARLLINRTWKTCCNVNVGMDLLKQTPSFSIDFGAMTLVLDEH